MLNDKIRNIMGRHAATLRRRNYICNPYHTDPIRLLLLKQTLGRLRAPIFSAQFILILLELTFWFYSLLCLSCSWKHLHGFPELSKLSKGVPPAVSQPIPAAHAAAKARRSLAEAKKWACKTTAIKWDEISHANSKVPWSTDSASLDSKAPGRTQVSTACPQQD